MFSPLTSSQDKHNPWMGNRAEVKETSPHHPHCSLSSHHLHRNTGRAFSSFTKDEAGNYSPGWAAVGNGTEHKSSVTMVAQDPAGSRAQQKVERQNRVQGSTGGNCQGDDRQESCSSAGNCQADEQTVITQLSRP